MPALTAGVLRRDPADVAPWAETCGQIRCLVEQKDGAAAEIHHVEIADAKLHYHAHRRVLLRHRRARYDDARRRGDRTA